MEWSPRQIDELERAIVDELRVQVRRRGTEYVIAPRELRSRGNTELLIGTTNVGDEMAFPLGDIEMFEVIY